MYIYQLINVKNGKRYIGQSKRPNHRMSAHRTLLRRKAHHNDFLQRDWNAQLETDFAGSILESCEDSIANERETFWINYFEGNVYNLQSGGTEGFSIDSYSVKKQQQSWTAEKRQKQSKLKTGVPLSAAHKEALQQAAQRKAGKERSEEVKQQISETLQGHTISEETKQKIRDSVRATLARKQAEGTSFTHTKESKEKIRQAAKAQWQNRKEDN